MFIKRVLCFLAMVFCSSLGFTQPGSGSEPLQDGVPLTDLSSNRDLRYHIDVTGDPSKVLDVVLLTTSGDPDLYVAFGREPTTRDYDCQSFNASGEAESCHIESIQTGRYHILVDAFRNKAFTASSLTATTSTPPSEDDIVQPSCDNIHLDDDEDGIPDCAELPGTTYFGMPLHSWGARPGQKDIFVEVDYMPIQYGYEGRNGEIDNHGMQPVRRVFDELVEEYANNGFVVHFDVGDLFDQSPGLDPADYDLGGGQEIPFEQTIYLSDVSSRLIPNYFSNNPTQDRQRAFYYIVFANTHSDGGSSGIAPDLFDYYAVVSVGETWELTTSSTGDFNELVNIQASTLMHEIGHVFGFSHGGFPDGEVTNHKPNYISAMNYLFQLQGTPMDYVDYSLADAVIDRYQLEASFKRGKTAANCKNELVARRPDNNTWGNLLKGTRSDPDVFHMSYSHGNQSDINERAIVEANLFDGDGQDFNCDGGISGSSKSFDINFDGNRRDTLSDHNDWSNLTLYYRYLNYKDGSFVAAGVDEARTAEGPQDIVPDYAPLAGALLDRTSTANLDARNAKNRSNWKKPAKIVEFEPSQEMLKAWDELRNRKKK